VSKRKMPAELCSAGFSVAKEGLYVNSWGGIRQNPTPLLTSEPFLYTALIHPVFGHAK